MKIPSQRHLFAVLAFMVLPGPICNSLDAQTDSKPTPPNESAYPRSKEGNMIVQVVDLLFAAQDATMQADFKGQTIEIIGQWTPDTTNSANSNRFKILRMFFPDEAKKPVQVSLLVESAAKPKVAENAWIKVVGTVEFRVESGRKIAVVKASKVETIDPPKETMLY